MHDPDLGVTVEGSRAAETEHLLAPLRLHEGPRTAKGWPLRLSGALSGQGGSTGLYGLGNGSGFIVGDLSFDVSTPEQARGYPFRFSSLAWFSSCIFTRLSCFSRTGIIGPRH